MRCSSSCSPPFSIGGSCYFLELIASEDFVEDIMSDLQFWFQDGTWFSLLKIGKST